MAFYRAIHHQKRFIALFSPKCACSSIKNWLNNIEQTSLQEENDNTPIEYLTELQYRSFIYGKDFQDYTKIIFVRDPLHRLVSFYNLFVVHFQRSSVDWHHVDNKKQFDIKEKTFEEFLQLLLLVHRDPDIELQHHLESQTMDTENLTFDFIIKVDKLSAGFRILNEELDLSLPATPRVNASPYNLNLTEDAFNKTPGELRMGGTPYYSYFYDDRLRKIAEEVYAEDFKLYQESNF
jgi:hypothetical protein